MGPSRTKLTYADYVRIPEDGKRHEILDGEHVVTPAPWTRHQQTSGLLQYQLTGAIYMRGLGRVYAAPTDVQLSEHDIVQPDLVGVLTDNQNIVTQAKIDGTPDLVVEILSRSTSERDRGIKKRIYERAGVSEYWIVDPDARAVEQYVLSGGMLALAGTHSRQIELHCLPGTRIDLTQVFEV